MQCTHLEWTILWLLDSTLPLSVSVESLVMDLAHLNAIYNASPFCEWLPAPANCVQGSLMIQSVSTRNFSRLNDILLYRRTIPYLLVSW